MYITKSCIWSSLDWKFILFYSFEFLWKYTGMWWWLQNSCMRLKILGHFSGLKELNNVALISHHNVLHTLLSFVRNTQAAVTLNISGHFHSFWIPLFEHLMCSGKMACSLQCLSNINACPVYWFGICFKF